MESSADQWIHTARTRLQESAVNFFQVKPARFWFDFLLSVTIAFTASSISMKPIGPYLTPAAFKANHLADVDGGRSPTQTPARADMTKNEELSTGPISAILQ